MASWLANLDEDWISEDGFETPSSPPSAPTLLPTLRVVPNTSNLQNSNRVSRIPRPKAAQENIAPYGTHLDVPPRLGDGYHKPADAENITDSYSKDAHSFAQRDRVALSRTSTLSTQASVGTQIHYQSSLLDGNTSRRSGTVSRLDENSQQALTYHLSSDADFKKKLTEAIINGGQFQDLFSPMNLERIFQPLNTAKRNGNLNQKQLSARLLRPSRQTSMVAPRLESQETSLTLEPASAKLLDATTATNNESGTMRTKTRACDYNETLPLATSTVRGTPKQEIETDMSPASSSYSRGNSTTRENANEKFSPISFTSGGIPGKSRKTSVAKARSLSSLIATEGLTPKDEERHPETAVATRTPSPLKLFASGYDTFTANILNERISQLASASATPEVNTTQEPVSPVRRSAKRTSMGETKPQSPGGAMLQKYQPDLFVPVGTSCIEMPSSPMLERTPKRMRLSNLSDCTDGLSPAEDQGDARGPTESLQKGSNGLAATSAQDDSGLEASGESTTDCAVIQDKGLSAHSEVNDRVLVKQDPHFRITGLTAIKTIPPSSVLNILPKQIGQMTFDEKQLMWIRSNSRPQDHQSRRGSSSASEIRSKDDSFSDDDPLRDISDLSVGNSVPRNGSNGQESGNATARQQRQGGTAGPSGSDSEASSDNESPVEIASSFRFDQFAESRLSLGIRQPLPARDSEVSHIIDRITNAVDETVNTDFSDSKDGFSEQEYISMLSNGTLHKGGRNYDYSSALGLQHDFSGIQRRDSDSGASSDSQPNSPVSKTASEGQTVPSNETERSYVPDTPLSNLRTPSMRLRNRSSFDRRKRSVARPLVSSIDEEGGNASDLELSLRGLEAPSRNSIAPSYLFSSPFKPVALKEIRSEIPPPSNDKNREVSFFNTPLPEISYHYLDAESAMHLEISYVAKIRGDNTRRRAITSFSAATNSLVKHLTDIEPYEPYWEYTKQLRLVDKDLVTLHTLNEFCPRIEDLDVQSNNLGQVTGVPSAVRELNVSKNRLSGLTAWGHLVNLQYLDVSGNDLDSLSGLKHLVHLRDLRADENQITNISDLFHLDGLLSFRARKNQIKTVNFDGVNLKRLNSLDLKDNQIDNISNIHLLPDLSSLNLDNNKLKTLGFQKGQKITSLRTLKMNRNCLESFDIAVMPNIRVLYLDHNRLERVNDLSLAKHLDSFSIRQQNLDSSSIPFDELQEVRKLYATGNQLSEFSIRQDFPNLQYLEIACAQLTSLPKDFGMMMSNVRVLNLNCNALSDLRPLCGIMRLKKLSLAGNRLNSLKKVSYILKYFPTLRELDLRFNPLTVGFYSHIPDMEVNGSITPNDTPNQGPGAVDEAFRGKMDIRTAIQRRCYEIIIGEHCPKLKKLDGLKFSAADTLKKDAIWEQMEQMGIVNRSG